MISTFIGNSFNATRRVLLIKCCGKQKCSTANKRNESPHNPQERNKNTSNGKVTKVPSYVSISKAGGTRHQNMMYNNALENLSSSSM
jgi:hypothetical protein